MQEKDQGGAADGNRSDGLFSETYMHVLRTLENLRAELRLTL